jgi:HEAT repeat protein
MTRELPQPSFASALAALVVAGALALPSHAGGGDSRWPTFVAQRTDSRFGRAIHKILDPNLLRGRVHEEVVDQLVALGPESIPALFAYFSGTMEGPEPEYTPAPEPVDESQPLPEPLSEDLIVLDAFKRFPKSKVVPQVTSAILHANVDVKLVGMRLYAEIGDAQAVEGWIDALADVPELQLQRAYVQAPSENALASVLGRDPGAFQVLSARTKALPAKLLPAVVRSVGGSESARGVAFLLTLLGRDDALDLVLIAQVARLAESTVGTLPDEQLNRLRPFLTDKDWRARREAVVALGRLQDHRSQVRVIELLGDEQRLVAQGAAWSLRRMSGQDLGEDAEAWREWFEAEQRWFQDEGVHWLQQLEDKDPARALEAVRELSHHPLYKHDVAEALAPLLHNENAELAQSVAATLGQLGSRRAIGALVGALSSEDEALRNTAWAALVQLTGKKLPADPSAWGAFVTD